MSAAIASTTRGQEARPGVGLLSRDAVLSLTVVLLLPLLLQAAGLAQVNRMLYPLTALAAAAYLYKRGSPWYVGLCVWLFAASPLVRRMADGQLGFELASPIILAPYLASAVAGLSLFPYLMQARPVLAWPFASILACVLYAFVLAVLDGRVASAVVDLLKWSIGPLMAVHLMASGYQREALHQVVLRAFVAAGIAMSIYGISQFLAPAPWDIEWLRNMILQGMTSSGRPEPFEIRVFSTMHSAGSFGAFLTVAFVLLLATPAPVALPGLALVGAGLALCQYRAVWAATGLAVLLVVLAAPGRVKLRVILGAAAVAIGLSFVATVPEVEDVLTKRVRSLTELGADASGEDRLSQYGRLLNEGSDLVLGSGLAITGAARQMDQRNATVIDSGLLEIILALGVCAGAVFLGCMAYLTWRVCTLSPRSCRHIYLYRGIVATWLLQLPFGSVHVGELGFGPWLCVGLALSSLAAHPDIPRAAPSHADAVPNLAPPARAGSRT